jgi:hypothetical protein
MNNQELVSKVAELDRLYSQGFTKGKTDRWSEITDRAKLKNVDSRDPYLMASSRGYRDGNESEPNGLAGHLGEPYYVLHLPADYDLLNVKSCRSCCVIMRKFGNSLREEAAVEIVYSWDPLDGGILSYYGQGKYSFKARSSMYGEGFDLDIRAKGIIEAIRVLAISHPEYWSVEVVPPPKWEPRFRQANS